MKADNTENADSKTADASSAAGEGVPVTSPFKDDTGDNAENWQEKGKEVGADSLADVFWKEYTREDESDDGADVGRGVTLDEDYSIGRWVTFPCAKMSGRVRKIVGSKIMDLEDVKGARVSYACECPDSADDSPFKRLWFDLTGHKTFANKEDAEKSLEVEEAERHKKLQEVLENFRNGTVGNWTTETVVVDYGEIQKRMEQFGSVVAQDGKDGGMKEKNNIFDPMDFDMNTWEWGAIWAINKIREAVKAMPDKTVITTDKFNELNKILSDRAKEYANGFENPHVKWIEQTVWSVPKAFANAFDTLSDGEGVSKEYFLKVFTIEAVCALAEHAVESIHDIEDFYNRNHKYWNRDSGYEIGNYVWIKAKQPNEFEVRRVVAFGDDDDDQTILVLKKGSNCIKRRVDQCSTPYKSHEDARKALEDDIKVAAVDNLNKGTKDMGIVQDAQVGATTQTQPGQTQQNAAPKPTMPKLDFAGLDKFLQGQQQGQPQVGNGGMQPQPQGQQPQNGGNPDVVAAQEEFKDVKEGDTYTDENGQKWVWSAIEFNVVPEEMKDEIVDDLTDDDDGNGAAETSDDISDDGDFSDAMEASDDFESDASDDAEGGVVTGDSAIDIVMRAADEVLGNFAVAQDFSDPKQLTKKQQGYSTNNPHKISATAFKRGLVSVNGQKVYSPLEGGNIQYNVGSYMPKAHKSAKEKARRSHRRTVAATYEKCKAKDKARCPYHGAAYMTDQLAKIIQDNGLPLGKYGIIMHNPETALANGKKEPVSYRLIFSSPEGTSEDIRQKIAKEFFDKNPNIIFEANSKNTGRYENNSVFHMKNPEFNEDDIPVDAPSQAEYLERHDTGKETEYGERAKARGAVSWTQMDELPIYRYFNMLSEHPTNMVECAEDMLRYAKQFPEMLPEGISLDDVKGTYDAFMNANARKRGLQAFIVNGETIDKAEALAVAAEQGLEKEGQAYYDASDNAYKLASDVFDKVQEGLTDQFFALRQETFRMPSGSAVRGEYPKGNTTVYFGDKFRSKQGKFPMNIGGVEEQYLREATLDYQKRWNAAAYDFDYILLGCEQREPLMVSYGLARLKVKINALKSSASLLGTLQDSIVENQDERWRKKHGIVVPGEKQQKQDVKNQETAHIITKAEVTNRAEKKAKPVKPAEQKVEKTEPVPKAEQRTASGVGAEGSTSKGADANLAAACKEAAMKDKSLVALDKKMKKMYSTFGADSEQFKTAQQKAIAALNAFKDRFYAKNGKGSSGEAANPETSTNEPKPSKQPENKGKMQSVQTPVKPKDTPQEPASAPATPPKNTATSGEGQNGQTPKTEPTQAQPQPPEKQPKKKPQSSVVRMAKGETANNSAGAEEDGAGLKLIKSMQIPDKPTMESAKALNKQFSDLEKRLRGLSYVFKSKTSDSKDWRAAEAEMKGIKSEIDSIIKKAQGKGYQWTKDSQSGDNRPLGVPVNFRISGIKDESGKTVNVPYAPPKAGAMDIPESKDNDDTPKPSKTESTAKPFQKKSDYSEDFEAITEKVGDLGVGPYKGKTIQDLMIEGYEVKPVTLGNGKKEWLFGKPDDTSRTGILMKSKENPPLVLSQWFSKRYGGNADDADALRHFAEALRWKIEQYNDFI